MRFRTRWIDLLHRAATGTKKTRKLLTPIGVTIFGAFTALFVSAASIVDRLLKGILRCLFRDAEQDQNNMLSNLVKWYRICGECASAFD